MSRMNKIMNFLFFSCQHATELVEKKEIVSLTLIEKIRFRTHLTMCSACRSYERQSALLEEMFGRAISWYIPKNEDEKLDASSKAKILDELRKVR